MLNAPINVVFFRCLCHCLFKNPGVETLRFYGFSPVCGVPVCGDFDGILRFFPCGWASVCVRTLRFYGFFRCVWGPCVWGLWDFTLFYLCVRPLCVGSLRFYGFEILRDFEVLRFSPVCGPCVGDFENFQKKIPNMEKSRVWGFEMAVTQRKKTLAI